VRMYSLDYRLLTNAIDGTCNLGADTGIYSCGAVGCRACDDGSPDPGSEGRVWNGNGAFAQLSDGR